MKVPVTVEVEHPEDTYTEVTYTVTLRLDKSPDHPHEDWWLEDIQPPPPNEYVEERVMEIACRMADRAIEDVVFEFPELARGRYR